MTQSPSGASVPSSKVAKRVQRQVESSGVVSGAPIDASGLLEARVLVVNQRARRRAANVEYDVYDQNGERLGGVQEIGRGLVRRLGDRGAESSRRYRLQIVDSAGRVVVAMLRPTSWGKSKMIVSSSNGMPIGSIAQANFGILRKVCFDLEAADQKVLGSIRADDWADWDFGIHDALGVEIARITKTWAGWTKERFTNADNYVVQIHRPLNEPLRSLVLAASLAVDVALKQGSATSGSGRRRRYH